MGKQTPTPPTPVDPVALSQAQGTANKDTAITSAELNAVNSNSPFGSVSYTQTPNPSDPSVPQFTATTSLSPEQQQLYNTQTGIEQQAYNTGATALNNVQSTLNQPFSLNGLPALQTSVNSNGPNVPLTAADFAQQGQDTTNALMQRFNTEWDKQNAANDAQLANQGIGLGSAAYAADKLNLNQAKNDAIGQALLAGNQEQNTLFGQSLASNQNAWQQALQNASLNNQGRQQMISEQARACKARLPHRISESMSRPPMLLAPMASISRASNIPMASRWRQTMLLPARWVICSARLVVRQSCIPTADLKQTSACSAKRPEASRYTASPIVMRRISGLSA